MGPLSSAHCPLCGSTTFSPTDQVCNPHEIAERWQAEAGVVFDGPIWQGAGEEDPCELRLHSCAACGFGIFQPVLTGTSGFYTSITKKEYYVEDKWEFHEAVKDIRRYQPKSILDIGCGSGAFLDMLRENSPRLVIRAGYESNPVIAEEARRKGHTVYDGDSPHSILLKGAQEASFDAISLFQVMEHVADPLEFLDSIRALLSAKGIAIVGVPNSTGPLRFFPNALTEIPPHHVSRWSASSFKVAMPKLGFRVEKLVYEPLPHYLWHSYLPMVWNSNVWATFVPKRRIGPEQMRKIVALLSFCHTHLPFLWQSRIWSGILRNRLDQDAFRRDVNKTVLDFIDRIRQSNIKWLWCVTGHSLYVVLRKR